MLADFATDHDDTALVDVSPNFDRLLAGIREHSYDELKQMLVQLDADQRRAEAIRAAIVTVITQTSGYSADGQHAVGSFLRSTLSCSNTEALRIGQLARACGRLPVLGETLLAGRVSVSNAVEVARLNANPRVRSELAASVHDLLAEAERFGHADFHTIVRRWETLTDTTGSFKELEGALERRHASVATVNGETIIRASIPGLAGSEVEEIIDRFAQIEFEFDVAAAKRITELTGAESGPLARTATQRRADALVAALRAGAFADDVVSVGEAIVNIVVDQATFEATVAEAFGERAPETASTVRYSETQDGQVIHPVQIVEAAVLGRVRRVVLDKREL
jgi:Domain of unknown function (DUF222)